MERRSSNFKCKPNERHDDASRKQRLYRRLRQSVRNRSETGASGHAIDQTDAKKSERTAGAAERSQHIKRESQQFESNENRKQLFAADQQHQTDSCQKNKRQIFASMTEGFLRPRQADGEKGKPETNDFEKRCQGRDYKHPAEKVRISRQHQHGEYSNDKSQAGNERAPAGSSSSTCCSCRAV